MNLYPERIVCLTEETTETLYLLGEEDRIVGISGFTVRPKKARKEKPVVSTFLDAQVDDILDLKPDLVIGFSDIQSKIAEELISKGVSVWVNNYRSVDGIFKMIAQLGNLVGKSIVAQELIQSYQNRIKSIQNDVESWNKKPLVYFEEWYDPLISGIQWVSELVEIAGGVDAYPKHRNASLAKDRIIENPQEVVELNPDIILASWCGKMYKPKRMFERENWKSIRAYQNENYYEIDSSIILQPGPAALTDGLEAIYKRTKDWFESQKKD
jgi:iron complex transport system substrate-binding protein